MRKEPTLWYLMDGRAASLFCHACHVIAEEEADWYAVWRCHLSRQEEEYLVGLIEVLPQAYIVAVDGAVYHIASAYDRFAVTEAVRASFGYVWQHVAVLMYIDGTVRTILAKRESIGRIHTKNSKRSRRGREAQCRTGDCFS